MVIMKNTRKKNDNQQNNEITHFEKYTEMPIDNSKLVENHTDTISVFPDDPLDEEIKEDVPVENQRKRVIMGIGLLLAIVSIAFSTYVTTTFVDGSAVYIALAPQVAYALYTLLKVLKLYK